MAVPVVRPATWIAWAGTAIAVLLVLLVALAPAGVAAGAPRAKGRAAILFLPWPDAAGGDRALLARLGARRDALAVGLTSPTTGGYAGAQVPLDMSQGTRVALRLYGSPPPALRPARERTSAGARLRGWSEVVERARAAPADLVPGLLADVVRRHGGVVAYAGTAAPPAPEAAVAADRGGWVSRVSLDPAGSPASRLLSLWRRSDLLVARLASGGGGLAALDRLLAERSRGDLVYVVRAPPAGERPRPPPLATGIAGPGLSPGGTLSSATTRRPGLVAATDVAPTVLERLGLPFPPQMEGRPIEGRAGLGGAVAARALRDRLGAIAGARPPALAALLGAWLAALGGLALARGRPGARAGLRLGLLAALWFPGLALATGALAYASPGSLGAALESAILALGSLGLALLTDRLLRWPYGPALPAAVVFCAYAVDLALGSPATALALTGPNPAAGARFYGLGNELETLLGVSVLIGTGAAASLAAAGPRRAAAAFAATGALAAAVMGAGRLGADVGAVITVAAGSAVAALSLLPGRRGRLRVGALALLAAALAVGALAVLDSVTGGGAHFSRSVLDARPRGLLEVAERRAATQLELLAAPTTAAVAGVALALLVAVVWGRRELLGPLAGGPGAGPGAAPLAAGLAGALAAVLVAAFANDSAPDVLAIGAVLLLLAAGYVRGDPSTARVA